MTAVIHRGAFDMNPSEHLRFKGLEKGEVRDHMTGLELAFVNVAEQATIANILGPGDGQSGGRPLLATGMWRTLTP